MQTPQLQPACGLRLLCLVGLIIAACGTDDGGERVSDVDATETLDGGSETDAAAQDGGTQEDAVADTPDVVSDTPDAADLGPDRRDIIEPDPCTDQYYGPSGELSGVLPVYTRGALEFSLMREGATEPVQGEIVGSVFYPAEYLEPSSVYEWTAIVHSGCPPRVGSFSTTSAGILVSNTESLVGRTFSVPSPAGDPSTAAGVALATIAEFGSDCGWPSGGPWRLRVDRLDENSADVVLAAQGFTWGEFRTQDTCVPSVAVTAQWDGIRLRLSGDSLPYGVSNSSGPWGGWGVSVPAVIQLRNWQADIVVHPQGDALTVAMFVAEADTRTLGEYSVLAGPDVQWEGNGTPENFCQVLESLIAPLALGDDASTTCRPCSDGVVACFPFVGWRAGGSPFGQPSIVDRLIDIDDEQSENHLCAVSCENGADDDGDGAVDDDPECNAAAWP